MDHQLWSAQELIFALHSIPGDASGKDVVMLVVENLPFYLWPLNSCGNLPSNFRSKYQGCESLSRNSWGGGGGGLYFIVKKLCRTNIPLFSFQIFTGNNDRNTIKYNEISRPAATRSVIFIPFQWNTNVGLRLELYGCLPGRCFERIISGFSNAKYEVEGYSWSCLLPQEWDAFRTQ